MQKIGKQTIKMDTPPTILDTACIVGPKESDGPLAKYFDQCLEDELWGEKTWEKAESKMIKETVSTVISKSRIASDQIDYCFAGDLLNQCISSCFGLRDSNVPFFRNLWCLFYFRRRPWSSFRFCRRRCCHKRFMCCF